MSVDMDSLNEIRGLEDRVRVLEGEVAELRGQVEGLLQDARMDEACGNDESHD